MATCEKFNYLDLIDYSVRLLSACGLGENKARAVSEILVKADLMGHRTHGLQLLPLYLNELQSGKMQTSGDAEVIRDTGSTVCLNGRYLPGPWLIQQAINQSIARIQSHPVVTTVIQRSHHIACLAAYLEAVTRNGLVILLSCSDPITRTVAPYGGIEGVYSPNPLAAGFPTMEDPILMDISMSSTANGLISLARDEGRDLPHAFILDNQGQVTTDPSRFFTDPPGTVLPLGGQEVGYKGFALGLLVEALTSALAGYGRSDEPRNWGASVFLQIIDPGAFGGLDHFRKEVQYLKEKSLQSRPIDAQKPVRIPGQKAMDLERHQRINGVELGAVLCRELQGLARRFDTESPLPINTPD